MSKKMKILIFSSLFLNVMLAGVLIGEVTHRFHIKNFVGKSVQEFASKLPGDKAALFLETVEKVRLKNQDEYKKLRQARKEAIKILSAPEFNEPAYQIRIEEIQELRSLMKRRLADATIELARKLNQEERIALAKDLRHLPRYLRYKSRRTDVK